jgi:hypothetical protein
MKPLIGKILQATPFPMARESQRRQDDSAWKIKNLTASLFYHLHCGTPLRFAFPEFFINLFFNK